MKENMGSLGSELTFAITDSPTNVLQHKVYDNVFFHTAQTSEYIPGPENVVRIDLMLSQFTGTLPATNQVSWFSTTVIDHCPVYAEFRADLDTD